MHGPHLSHRSRLSFIWPFVQDARIYCQEIRDTIKILKSNRDMAFNEIKLTVAIEDPRARERRENLGIEVGHLHTPACRMHCCIVASAIGATPKSEQGCLKTKQSLHKTADKVPRRRFAEDGPAADHSVSDGCTAQQGSVYMAAG